MVISFACTHQKKLSGLCVEDLSNAEIAEMHAVNSEMNY